MKKNTVKRRNKNKNEYYLAFALYVRWLFGDGPKGQLPKKCLKLFNR